MHVGSIALSILILILCARAQLLSSFLPFNATCAEINAVEIKCVELDHACNSTTEALTEALANRPVYLCRSDATCVSSTCVRVPSIGEPCTDTIGCFDKDYSVQCDTICRGANVFGAGEPASFKPTAVCDISATSLMRNGGCLQGSQASSSLICTGDPDVAVCSSAATGDDCPAGIECLADSYCNNLGVCTLRSAASCNFTNGPAFGDACEADRHCTPADQCALWFGGGSGDSCSINEDCDVGMMCDTATQACKAVTSSNAGCSSPADVCTNADDICECTDGDGACTALANTQAYETAWTALTTCVKAHGCFPVVPGTNGAQSVIGLTFFEGGCYDTFCRKEWLALRDPSALCTAGALSMHVPSLVLVALALLAAIMMLY